MWLTVDQACQRLGITASAVRMRVHRGLLKSRKTLINRRVKLEIDIPDDTVTTKNTYDWHHQQWCDMQASGLLTGRPISKRGVESNVYGLKLLWRLLAIAPSIENATIDNAELAISKIPVEVEKQKCHFSMRFQLSKGFRSFTKYLVKQKLKQPVEEERLKNLCTANNRLFKPKKTSLKKLSLQEFLAGISGQSLSRFDTVKYTVIVLLMSHAGLRRQEVVDINKDDIDFSNKIVFVACGKGYKSRKVGLNQALETALTAWLPLRPNTDNPALIQQSSGRRYTTVLINKHIKKLADALGFDVTPHGFRRTFATLLAQQGVPLVYIQHQLGHSNIKTTMQYIMTDEDEAMKAIQLAVLL